MSETSQDFIEHVFIRWLIVYTMKHIKPLRMLKKRVKQKVPKIPKNIFAEGVYKIKKL